LLNHLTIAAAACTLLAVCVPSVAIATDAPPHVYLQLHIDINKAGYFFDVLPIDMTVTASAEAACVAFTGDAVACAASAAAMGRRAHPIPHDKQDGARHTGFFQAPLGYEICKTRIHWADTSLDTGSSIAATMVRNTDGLGAHNDPDRNGLAYDIQIGTGGSSPYPVKTILDLDFIDAKLAADPTSGCFPTGLKPWDCQGTDGACVEPEAKG
jgi:hypothetical protein